MDAKEFCLWLHGYMELTDEHKGLTANQVQIIKDHLDLVFNKVTPDRTPSGIPYCVPKPKEFGEPSNPQQPWFPATPSPYTVPDKWPDHPFEHSWKITC